MITIVSSDVCPYCIMAKQLITDLGGEYAEIKVAMWSAELMEIVQITWQMTVPQIFDWEILKENLLGGYSEIQKLHQDWKFIDIITK